MQEHKCPVCGNNHFFVTAEISQEWEVNEFGGIIRRPVSEKVIMWPQENSDSIWKCTKCGWSGPEVAAKVKGVSLRKRELATMAYLSKKYANPILPEPVHFEKEKPLNELFDMAKTKCSIILMEPITHKELKVHFLLRQLCDEENEKNLIKCLRSYDRNGYVPLGISINKIPVPTKDRVNLCSIKDVVEYAQKSILDGKYRPSVYIAGFYANQDTSPTWLWTKSMDGKICVWCGSEPFKPFLNVYKLTEVDGKIFAERVSRERPMFPDVTYMDGPCKLLVSDEDAKVIRDTIKRFNF